jgi:hypothetical protein
MDLVRQDFTLQGDQIGRIFAYWATVYELWVGFLKVTEVAEIIGVLVSTVKYLFKS